MPKLSSISRDVPAKVLLVGFPGTGKTGSICSLVKAGYRVFVLNFEGETHMAPLWTYLTDEEQERVIVQTLKDDLRLEGKQVWPRKPPTAFTRGMFLLDRWKDDEDDYGSVYDWSTSDVLVVDSLTSMGEAAMWYVKFINNRKGKNLRDKDWGDAIRLQGDFLDMLNSESIRCNIVVTSHLTPLSSKSTRDEDEDDAAPGAASVVQVPSYLEGKLFPTALGQKLPPKVASKFSVVVEAQTVGAGKNTRRILRTVPTPEVDLKLPAIGMPTELPIEDGMSKIFQALRRQNAKEAA